MHRAREVDEQACVDARIAQIRAEFDLRLIKMDVHLHDLHRRLRGTAAAPHAQRPGPCAVPRRKRRTGVRRVAYVSGLGTQVGRRIKRSRGRWFSNYPSSAAEHHATRWHRASKMQAEFRRVNARVRVKGIEPSRAFAPHGATVLRLPVPPHPHHQSGSRRPLANNDARFRQRAIPLAGREGACDNGKVVTENAPQRHEKAQGRADSV